MKKPYYLAITRTITRNGLRSAEATEHTTLERALDYAQVQYRCRDYVTGVYVEQIRRTGSGTVVGFRKFSLGAI